MIDYPTEVRLRKALARNGRPELEDGMAICTNCRGDGGSYVQRKGGRFYWLDCPRCKGTGEVPDDKPNPAPAR